jgi:hypothetical protein
VRRGESRNVMVDDLEGRWAPELGVLSSSMAAWRQEHPRATLTEIEEALDERLGAVRARMLEDTALASAAASFAGLPREGRPQCPRCGQRLVSRGQAERTLTTSGGREIRLQRSYGLCRSCGQALFPPR